MKQIAMDLMNNTYGTFEACVEGFVLDDLNGMLDGNVPAELTHFNTFITELKQLLLEARDGFEDTVTSVYAKHFTEAEATTLLELFLRTKPMAAEFVEATTKWRNGVLDKHREKLAALLGTVEAPTEAPPPPSAA